MTDEIFECRDPNGVPFAETNNYVDRRWAMKTIAEKDARIAKLEAALKKLREAARGVDQDEMHYSQRDEWGYCLTKADEALKGES